MVASSSCLFVPLQHVRPALALGQVSRLAFATAVWTLTCGGLTMDFHDISFETAPSFSVQVPSHLAFGV